MNNQSITVLQLHIDAKGLCSVIKTTGLQVI